MIAERVRYWDTDWNLIWDTNGHTPEENQQFIHDWLDTDDYLNCSKDFADGYRWSGRVYLDGGDLMSVQHIEFMEKITAWLNPLL